MDATTTAVKSRRTLLPGLGRPGDGRTALGPHRQRLLEAGVHRLGPHGVGVREPPVERQRVGRGAGSGHQLEGHLQLAAGLETGVEVPVEHPVIDHGRGGHLRARRGRLERHAAGKRHGEPDAGVRDLRAALALGIRGPGVSEGRSVAVWQGRATGRGKGSAPNQGEFMLPLGHTRAVRT